MINPHHLRTFITLVETQHFTKTAESLHMTQPGVSQHIKKLEAHLNCQIISRFGKKFELTEAGVQLYEFAQKQFQAEGAFLDILSDVQAEKGEIKLACSGSIVTKLYSDLLQLQKRYPDLSVCMEAAPNHEIINQIKGNRVDLGLVTQLINDAELEQHLLGYDPLCLLIPKGFEADWRELMELGFINHPDGHHYAVQVLESNFADHFRGMGEIKHSGYINQLSQIFLPVAEGMGFTVLPESSIVGSVYYDAIKIANLAQVVKEPVYRVQKKYRPLPKRYNLLEGILQKHFSM
ncbi:LysR family transcriptional regulator [Neptuniibacter sp. QD29_5]|uniref:LysR family transcriptional regulator n=1 Tax=Neptuniibacter sp. QD29_5 TaxID=3398207 RepID=UPI0039F60FF3